MNRASNRPPPAAAAAAAGPHAGAARPRWRRLWPWCAAVLAGHALLLAGSPLAWGDGASRSDAAPALAQPRVAAAVLLAPQRPAPVRVALPGPSATAEPPRHLPPSGPAAQQPTPGPHAAPAAVAARANPPAHAPTHAPAHGGAPARADARPDALADVRSDAPADAGSRPGASSGAPAGTPARDETGTDDRPTDLGPEPGRTAALPEPPAAASRADADDRGEGAWPAPLPAAPALPAPAAILLAQLGAPPPVEAAATAPPVYATRLPPAARLRYDLRRGALAGEGELRFERGEAGRYTLVLQGRVLGATFLEWQSSGGVDAHGLAPERFVDRRRGRAANAANFQHGAGRITYSGSATQAPLFPGTQDRLSFMLQLGAIVAAAPQAHPPGAQVRLFVSGARGDADAWTFTVLERRPIEVPAGPVPGAVHLRREPRKPYDTQVDIWLDPARGYLPARIRLAVPQTGDATDFLLSGP